MPEIRESMSTRMCCSGRDCTLPMRNISKGTVTFVGYTRSGQINLCFDCFDRLHFEFTRQRQTQENSTDES